MGYIQDYERKISYQVVLLSKAPCSHMKNIMKYKLNERGCKKAEGISTAPIS